MTSLKNTLGILFCCLFLILSACSQPDGDISSGPNEVGEETKVDKNKDKTVVSRGSEENVDSVIILESEASRSRDSLIYRVGEGDSDAKPLEGEALVDDSKNIPVSSTQDSVAGSSNQISVIEDSVGGPSDTAMAEIKILYVQNDLAKIRIEKIKEYFRHPDAVHSQLKIGDEIEARIYHFAPSSSSTNTRIAEGSNSTLTTIAKAEPIVDEKYLANMSICLAEYGFGCAYEGWSVALYSL